MTIVPISETVPACYGVCCTDHGECQRYAAVEAALPGQTIGTCDDGQGGRPLFVPLVKEPA